MKLFRCDTCADLEKPLRAGPAAPPGLYLFNHEVILDVFEVHDTVMKPFLMLSIVCDGTCFQICVFVAEGTGVPSSAKCLRKFMSKWVSWAGWPRVVATDRGLHNRGAFAHGLADNGVYQRQAGLENPEAIGRGERHNGI